MHDQILRVPGYDVGDRVHTKVSGRDLELVSFPELGYGV